jgi:hypothetical protein
MQLVRLHLGGAHDGVSARLCWFAAGPAVGLYKLNAFDPWIESIWFQPLILKCAFLVSNHYIFSNPTCTATLRLVRAHMRWGSAR